MVGSKLKVVKASTVFLALLGVLVCLSIFALRIGSMEYSTGEIINSLADKDSTIRTIVMDLRLPRVILAIIIGIALASSGALLQAVMQNPLADPGIIGVSSGASVVATAILLVAPSLTGSLPLFSFLGAGIACFLIYTLAWKDGIDPVRIILAGVAINAVLGGISSLLTMMNSDSLEGVLAWMNGSLSAKSWGQVELLFKYSIFGIVASLFCIKSANALQLGDEMAKNLGIKVNLTRVILSGIAAYLAATTVAVAGIIGFVGLVVPHIARLLVGSDYKVLLPISMVLGSCIVLFADTIGRTIVAPIEIPLGIIMSVIGGPFFLYLLRKGGKSSAC